MTTPLSSSPADIHAYREDLVNDIHTWSEDWINGGNAGNWPWFALIAMNAGVTRGYREMVRFDADPEGADVDHERVVREMVEQVRNASHPQVLGYYRMRDRAMSGDAKRNPVGVGPCRACTSSRRPNPIGVSGPVMVLGAALAALGIMFAMRKT